MMEVEAYLEQIQPDHLFSLKQNVWVNIHGLFNFQEGFMDQIKKSLDAFSENLLCHRRRHV
jgi:hypothetical protein